MLSFLRVPIRRQQLLLGGVDLLILFLSLPFAVFVRGLGAPSDLPRLTIVSLPGIVVDFFRFYTGATTIAIVVFLGVFFVFDLYSPERKYGSPRDLLFVLFVSGVATLLIPVFYYLAPSWKLGRGQLALQGLFVGLAAWLWRVVYSHVHRRIARPRRVLLIGAGASARALMAEIQGSLRGELEIVGALDDDPAKREGGGGALTVLGGTRDVGRVAREREVEIIVFAIPRQTNPIDADLMKEILGLKTTGIEVYQMPTFFKKISGRIPVEFVEETWLIFNQSFAAQDDGTAARVRRLLDLSLSLGALAVLSPVLLLVIAAIKLTSRGPVLYRQERLGLHRRPYNMLKFRSMVADAERGKGPVWSAGRRDSRVTAVGRFLRRTRMDEVPNFLNVLKGEMSIVGPRPERAHFVEMLEREIPYYGLRFAVKPGMTGWAQVNYSYGASVEDSRKKLEYELFYIQERSLFLDLLILLKTAQTVMLRPGS